jgi:hypothetical protein
MVCKNSTCVAAGALKCDGQPFRTILFCWFYVPVLTLYIELRPGVPSIRKIVVYTKISAVFGVQIKE